MLTEATIIFIALGLLAIGCTVFVYFPRKDRFDQKGLTYKPTPWDETEKKRDEDPQNKN